MVVCEELEVMFASGFFVFTFIDYIHNAKLEYFDVLKG